MTLGRIQRFILLLGMGYTGDYLIPHMGASGALPWEASTGVIWIMYSACLARAVLCVGYAIRGE